MVMRHSHPWPRVHVDQRAAGLPCFVSVWENGDVGGDTFRWWCTTAAPIVIGGNQALACQLTPGNWSDVNGQNGSAQVWGFNDAIANPFAVGFTFGGMYAGHGVQVTGGQAMFKVNSFTIQLERK
jgi:hypothetical protein